MSYISCSVCAKTLLLFCVYEQRLYHVFVMYVIAMHVHWSDKAKNSSIYCILQTCRCAKAEFCLCNVCVNVVYELNAESSAVTALCVIALRVNRSENAKNQSIYCITSVCICAKAESCLCNICIYVIYELQHICKDVAVILCIDKLQRVDDHVVIALLFNCVWAQHVSKALLLLCRCWWDYSTLLTSIACKRFVVSILYR